MYPLFTPLKKLSIYFFTLLIFYTCLRISFVSINASSFPQLNNTLFLKLLWHGLRFDISAIISVNSLFIFLLVLPFGLQKYYAYQVLLKYAFILPNAIALFFEVADWFYFPYNHKRSTAEVLSMVSRKGDFLNLLPSFLRDFWYAFFIAAFLLFLLFSIYNHVESYFQKEKAINRWVLSKPQIKSKWLFHTLQTLLFLFVLALSVIGIRGGFQLIPINIKNTAEVAESQYAPIILNTPYSIINTVANQHLSPIHFMDEEKAFQLVQPIKHFEREKDFKAKNVVFIILESFSREFTGLGPGKSYTPFLDSLMNHSYVFTNAFANGLHSAEGIPAIFSGLPSLMSESFSVSAYSTNNLTSLPSLLQPLGYHSAFFHGASNGSMNFDVYAKSAGFDQYFGRSEYNNDKDFDGSWGIFDEPFLQFFADKMKQQKEPFINAVFTVTSHSPYPIPEKYKNRFKNDGLEVQSTILYTDYALQQFFNTVKDAKWFQNTLFIITADHCSPMASSDYYAVGTGRYEIPILFFCPNDPSLVGKDSTLMQQIDILPTVLDYLNYTYPFYALGNSAFQKNTEKFVINKLHNTDYWIHRHHQMHITNNKIQAVYHFPGDYFHEPNLLNDAHFQIDSSSFHLWQAFTQVYTNGLIENTMYYKARKQRKNK